MGVSLSYIDLRCEPHPPFPAPSPTRRDLLANIHIVHTWLRGLPANFFTSLRDSLASLLTLLRDSLTSLLTLLRDSHASLSHRAERFPCQPHTAAKFLRQPSHTAKIPRRPPHTARFPRQPHTSAKFPRQLSHIAASFSRHPIAIASLYRQSHSPFVALLAYLTRKFCLSKNHVS